MRLYTKKEVEEELTELCGEKASVPDLDYLSLYSEYVTRKKGKCVKPTMKEISVYVASTAIEDCNIDLSTLDKPTLFGSFYLKPHKLYYWQCPERHQINDPIFFNEAQKQAVELGYSVCTLIIPGVPQKIMAAQTLH